MTYTLLGGAQILLCNVIHSDHYAKPTPAYGCIANVSGPENLHALQPHHSMVMSIPLAHHTGTECNSPIQIAMHYYGFWWKYKNTYSSKTQLIVPFWRPVIYDRLITCLPLLLHCSLWYQPTRNVIEMCEHVARCGRLCWQLLESAHWRETCLYECYDNVIIKNINSFTV